MAHPQHPGRTPRPVAQPQLRAFCRTRRLRSQDGPCHASTSPSLLYVVMALQLSTVLLLLTGPVPPAAAPLLQNVGSRA